MTEIERIVALNDAPESSGDYVLYWMQQSQRAAGNPALELAIAEGNRLRLPVVVGFGLTDRFPEANARHYGFMLEGLAETAEMLRERGVAFVIRRGAPDEVAIGLARRAALIVCDRGYLRVQREWRSRVARAVGRRVIQVEGDAVVPVGLVSTEPAIAARTLRSKLLRLRDRFLVPLVKRRVQIRADHVGLESDVDLTDVPGTLARLRVDHRIAPVTTFRGGYTEARRHLRRFVNRTLGRYAESRLQPGDAQVSHLSPYLHFGQISPVEIALAAQEDTFLDELIVRRELAMNFVETTPNYDAYECLPAWARRTLSAHRRDRRPHRYRYEQLANGETHDPYWNAAMHEMRSTGYMHNYMRMYWGKKVLEWSPSPEEAYGTLLRLNNTYFLDGRDANSYANVGWVFGLHDRPWPERPIFGNVRSMTAGGLERKTDIEAYVRRIATL